MNIEEISEGVRVRVIGEPDVGTVDRVDLDDHMVWVALPVSGQERTQIVDLDPAELELVS